MNTHKQPDEPAPSNNADGVSALPVSSSRTLMTAEQIHAEVKRIREYLGIPNCIPVRPRGYRWDLLSEEQIIAEIEHILIKEFEIPTSISPGFLEKIPWKQMSSNEINEEVWRLVEELRKALDKNEESVDDCDLFEPQGDSPDSPLFVEIEFDEAVEPDEWPSESTPLGNVDFEPQGNLTGSPLYVGQRLLVESESGRFIGKVGNLQSGADTGPVAVRNGAIRLWPDSTPGISKVFSINQTSISSE